MVDIGKDKLLYLYLDKESITAYVGETIDFESRKEDHVKYDSKYEDKYPGRAYLMENIEPVIIKADFKNMDAVYFAEHAAYEKYKELGYRMVQKPPHPNIFAKYHDRIDDCKICDELGCDFTKERLEYILAVHRVSKLCPTCNKPFYFDPKKYQSENAFNEKTYCSKDCHYKSAGSRNISRLCPTCNKPFYYNSVKHAGSLPKFNETTYCSNTCSMKGKYNTGSYNVSKLCPTCNKIFYFDKKKHVSTLTFNERTYCSHICANKGSVSHNVSKLCPICNKVFYYDNKKYKGLKNFNKQKGCSFSHSQKIRYNTGSHNVSKLCPACNDVFYYEHKKYRSLPAFNKKKSCSRDCADIIRFQKDNLYQQTLGDSY
jgi:hypothetical protein